ncbi:MAG: hypothetical protein J6A75_03935 [Lachnospiraceae bacterium]|nr:hypothetical protein [Lachnospiraceae bacterium]
MPCDVYEAAWMFFIYACIGWCTEVIYVGLNKGHFVNRGFFNGPICPIYGIGVLIVVAVLTPLKNNFILLFLGSMVLTSLLEFLTGLILEKLFSQKWWDYSDMPFNIKGYVCLKFSIYWGMGCMLVMNVVHPGIYRSIRFIPRKLGIIFLVILLVLFIADLCVTVNILLKFNRNLRSMEKIANAIHKLSDEVGEDIFEKASAVVSKREDIHEDLKEKRMELERLNEEYKRILEERYFGFKRLIKAFPSMRSKKWDELLQQLKKEK